MFWMPFAFNSASMGSLRALESSCVMEQIPRNPDQLTATLEQIVSGFADTDEILELHDSVSEYNASVDPAKQIPLSTIIVFLVGRIISQEETGNFCKGL